MKRDYRQIFCCEGYDFCRALDKGANLLILRFHQQLSEEAVKLFDKTSVTSWTANRKTRVVKELICASLFLGKLQHDMLIEQHKAILCVASPQKNICKVALIETWTLYPSCYFFFFQYCATRFFTRKK